ncbi:hypothetical protein CWB96_06435 [Pseudoalteromonas citrea]|uniref:Uncharacterized protein n=1 Tax=Pseudoalteromonas citrea TaxID=43655 RepID=A0A5S3XRR9_9GAMM|nr:hypothetical protein CWB97_13745 [Pseudoalteromonas citrea]TMP60601.1 hypothetical protein CWB96_06435 [Pseudoalteromonas citrea]
MINNRAHPNSALSYLLIKHSHESDHRHHIDSFLKYLSTFLKIVFAYSTHHFASGFASKHFKTMDSDLRQKDELYGASRVGWALCRAYYSVDSDLRQKDKLCGTSLVGKALCRAHTQRNHPSSP